MELTTNEDYASGFCHATPQSAILDVKHEVRHLMKLTTNIQYAY